MPATTIHPPSRGVHLIWVFVLLPLFATLTFLLRVLARRLKRAGLKADDWFIALALIFTWAVGIDGVVGVYHGYGEHVKRIPPAILLRALYNSYLFEIFRGFTLLAAKISILLLYRRINPDASFRRLVYLVMAFCVAYSTAAITTVIFQCSPRSRYWNKRLPGTCIDAPTFYKVSSTINMVTDIVIFLLPLHMVWTVRLPARQKLAITGVFAIGLLTCIASIIRLPTLPGSVSADATYDGYGAAIASSVEMNLAIATANLTVLRPLFRGFQRFSDAKSSAYSASSGGVAGPGPGPGLGSGGSKGKGSALTRSLSRLDSFSRQGMTTTGVEEDDEHEHEHEHELSPSSLHVSKGADLPRHHHPSSVTLDESVRPWPASHV